jgi:hypothetical protein
VAGVLALLIPIVSVGGFFAWMIALSPVGKAYADKLRGKTGQAGGAGDHEEVLEALDQLRREVAELAERVDFTERLLGQQRDRERVGPPQA